MTLYPIRMRSLRIPRLFALLLCVLFLCHTPARAEEATEGADNAPKTPGASNAAGDDTAKNGEDGKKASDPAANPFRGTPIPPVVVVDDYAALRKSEKPASAEFEEFAQELFKQFAAGNKSYLKALLNYENITRRVVQDYTPPGSVIDAIRRMYLRVNYPSGIVEWRKQHPDTEVTLQRCITDAEGTKAIIRLASLNEGVKWIEFYLSVSSNQNYSYSDLFLSEGGQIFSRRDILTTQPLLEWYSNPKNYSNATPELEIFSTHARAILQIVKLHNSRRTNTALEKYYEFPEDFRRNFRYQLLLLILVQAIGVDTPEYVKAVDEIWEYNRNFDAAKLALFNYYYLKKDYARFRECAAAASARYAPDGWISLLIAKSYLNEGNSAKCIEFCKKARADEPTIADTYDLEASCYLKQPNHLALKMLWLDFQKAFPTADITAVFSTDRELYATFMKSQEYKELLRECAALRKKSK